MFRGDLATNTKLTKTNNNNHTIRFHNFTGKIRPKDVQMVSTGKRNTGTERDMVDRLKPQLHNFDLPCLKWGNQKLLRCMKVDSNSDVSVFDRNQSSESGGGAKRRNSEAEKRFRSSYDVDRNHSSESGGGIGTYRRNSECQKRFRSSYDDDVRKTESCYKFSSSEKVNVDRKQPSGSGGGGAVIGAKRRNSECEKRFRSSYDDVDRKIQSYCKFSSSEKVNVDSNVNRILSSDGGGAGGVVIGAKRFRSSYDDFDRKIQSCYKFSSSEKPPARNGIGNLISGDGEIEATREKLMFDFQNEVVKMKDAILRERLVDPPPSTTAAAASTPPYNPPAERPWNLRTRRAACKAPRSPANGVNNHGEVLKPNSSPATKLRPASGVSGESTTAEERERPKFSVSLSRRELEEDFMAMAGQRLPRKPKRRPRAVQKQLDTLFPGLWLSEITADLYKVPDEAETGKR
ncbi:hypothetical protein Hdeb2414_s0025g00660821 [Helianthus debilis subsp. tardiflorus]